LRPAFVSTIAMKSAASSGHPFGPWFTNLSSPACWSGSKPGETKQIRRPIKAIIVVAEKDAFAPGAAAHVT
jgi:hypothetical protein